MAAIGRVPRSVTVAATKAGGQPRGDRASPLIDNASAPADPDHATLAHTLDEKVQVCEWNGVACGTYAARPVRPPASPEDMPFESSRFRGGSRHGRAASRITGRKFPRAV